MHRTEGSNNVDGLFSDGPPATTVTAAWLNAIQEEIINVIIAGGLSPKQSWNDTERTQLYQAIVNLVKYEPYDYIVTSQADFNNLIERVAANQYKIKDDYLSVLIRNKGVGYECSGPLSFLSGGDTWGYIQTNLCSHIVFEQGAYLDFNTERGYLYCNTVGGYFQNVWINGSTGASSAELYCFYVDGSDMTFNNCRASNRTSSALFMGFYGDADYTNKFIACKVNDLSGGGGIRGFSDCYNISNSVVYDLTSTGGTPAIGIAYCENVSSCIVKGITDGAVTSSACGIRYSRRISACYVEDIYGYSAMGIDDCYSVSSTRIYTVESTAGDAEGISNTYCISACYVTTITADSGDAFGMSTCYEISACRVITISSSSGVAEGYNNCIHGAAIHTTEPVNSGNDYMDTTDAQVVNKVSIESFFT